METPGTRKKILLIYMQRKFKGATWLSVFQYFHSLEIETGNVCVNQSSPYRFFLHKKQVTLWKKKYNRKIFTNKVLKIKKKIWNMEKTFLCKNRYGDVWYKYFFLWYILILVDCVWKVVLRLNKFIWRRVLGY